MFERQFGDCLEIVFPLFLKRELADVGVQLLAVELLKVLVLGILGIRLAVNQVLVFLLDCTDDSILMVLRVLVHLVLMHVLESELADFVIGIGLLIS